MLLPCGEPVEPVARGILGWVALLVVSLSNGLLASSDVVDAHSLPAGRQASLFREAYLTNLNFVILCLFDLIAKEHHMAKMTYQQQATFVIKTLKEWGLSTVNTRLDTMNKVLEKGYIPTDDPDFPIAQEALLDLSMIAFVLDQLKEFPQRELKAKLKLLVKDSPLLGPTRENSLGRDTQIELYIAAVCKNAGMQVELDEPDIIAELGGQRYSLAIKRLKSRSKFESRFKDAADQIEKWDKPGFIVLDLRQAFNPENIKVQGTDDEIDAAFRLKWQRFRDNIYSKMKEWQRGREIRGVLLVDHVIYDNRERWASKTLTYGINLSPGNQRRTKEFDEFTQVFATGLPN